MKKMADTKVQLLQIAQLGNPILRQKANEIENIKDDKIQDLIDNLLATMHDANGVGIAAPQVYLPYRIFIVASHPNPRYPNAPEMDPTPMINPKLIKHNNEKHKDWEGCLSIPGIRGLVPRFTQIEVEYSDRYGKLVKQKYADFVARIFQHELDHLDGIVFLDRMESNLDLITDKEYQKLIAKKHNKK